MQMECSSSLGKQNGVGRGYIGCKVSSGRGLGQHACEQLMASKSLVKRCSIVYIVSKYESLNYTPTPFRTMAYYPLSYSTCVSEQ